MKVVKAIDPHTERRNSEAAEFMRRMADRFEAGEILDCVLVWNDLAEKGYGTWGDFRDRWRILGALEYAKQGVGVCQ